MQQAKETNLRNKKCEFIESYNRNRKIFWVEPNHFYIKTQICPYFLSIILFVCIFTLVVQILAFNHRTIHLNDSAKIEFITRNEIDGVILNVLKKLRNNGDIIFSFNQSNIYKHNVEFESVDVMKTR